MNWSDYPNFSEAEMRCRQTGECGMHPDHMARLQRVRDEFGKPMPVTSGYRSPRHSIEAAKSAPGVHTTGRATDVGVCGADALELVGIAIKHGFTGIGVNQRGGSRFIHLDDAPSGFPRPMIWSY